MKKSRTLLLIFVLLGVGAFSAHAAGSGTIPTLSTTGASFTSGTYVWAGQKVYDTNGDPAGSAQISVCRDRGALFPDNCVTSSTFLR